MVTRLLLLLLWTLPVAVQAQYNYQIMNGTVIITGGNCFDGAVTIPSTIEGLPVTAIGVYAFSQCHNLISVTIPDSVTIIGRQAFEGCTSLTNVTIPDSVTTIGEWAFSYCTSLTSVTIPNSVTTIGKSAFYECTSLTTVTTPDSVTAIGDQAFRGCTSLTSLTIPNSVTTIGHWAFSDCTSLTTVTIPDSVTAIGVSAFHGCAGLTNVIIPNSVTTLDGTFSDCTGLTSITIPDSVTTLDGTFHGCTSLTAVIFKGNFPAGGGDPSIFRNSDKAIVYYLPETTGWDSKMLGGRPAVLWNPQVLTNDASFGVRAGQFGFTITGTSGLVIVVEASEGPANPIWTPVGTNTLTGGSSYFSDPQWTNHSSRFYRFRAP